jgi:hypothetical protein
MEIVGLIFLFLFVLAVYRGRPEQRHRRTDPACAGYSTAGRLRRWLNSRGRGKSCPVCVPSRCTRPPFLWLCSAEAGHTGPCPARKVSGAAWLAGG